MPKPGYTQLIVKRDIRDRLEEIAKAQGYRTVNQLLETWLNHGVNPRVNPQPSTADHIHPETA